MNQVNMTAKKRKPGSRLRFLNGLNPFCKNRDEKDGRESSCQLRAAKTRLRPHSSQRSLLSELIIPGSEVLLEGRTNEWNMVVEIHFEHGLRQGPMLDLDTIHSGDDPGFVRATVAMVKQREFLLIRKKGKDSLPRLFGWTLIRAQRDMVECDPITFCNLYFITSQCRFKHKDCLEMILSDPALEL